MEFKIPMPWGHVAAKSYGSWHGQPLLAIHDWLDNSGSFEQLSRDIQFVVIDLQGHGLSSHVPLGIQYHRIDMVTVVKRIVEHQKWKKFSILGHGVGAEIAILYAASLPTLVILNAFRTSHPKRGNVNSLGDLINMEGSVTLDDEKVQSLVRTLAGPLHDQTNGIPQVTATDQEEVALRLARGEAEAKRNDDGSVELAIPAPWGTISAKTFGSPFGKPVLAVHGWMDNAGTFDRLVPLLPKSIYFVAVDLPGHGRSSHLPAGVPYHYTDFIIALRRITNFFKWTKFSWIGHSMGAGLGALYASSFPSNVNIIRPSRKAPVQPPATSKLIASPSPCPPQVERLIMLDLVKPITGDSGEKYATMISLAIDQFLALEDKIQPIPPAYEYDAAVESLVKGTGDSLTLEAAKTLMIRGTKKVGDKWAFTRDLRLRSPSILRFSHEQCFTILSELRSPTMIIKASNAPWFEPKEICEQAMEIYKKNCSNFQYVEVEVEGNHFVHLNEPENIAETINQFLTEPKVAAAGSAEH